MKWLEKLEKEIPDTLGVLCTVISSLAIVWNSTNIRYLESEGYNQSYITFYSFLLMLPIWLWIVKIKGSSLIIPKGVVYDLTLFLRCLSGSVMVLFTQIGFTYFKLGDFMTAR